MGTLTADFIAINKCGIAHSHSTRQEPREATRRINNASGATITLYSVTAHVPRRSVQISQTRHNFVGEIRICSVKIRINPYPSFMHRCIAKTFTRCDAVCQKIATLCNKNRQPAAKNQNRSFTLRIRPTPLID